MAELGKSDTLKVVKIVDFGVYLDGGLLGEILLPRKYVPENCPIGRPIEVFIYHDSQDRMIATTQKPLAQVGQAALLKVKAATEIGAFLDWGLPRDLFVPFREQKQRMDSGKSYIVFVYLDEKSQRVVASSKLDKFIHQQPVSFGEGEMVKLLIYDRTEMGYKAIVNGTHWGMLYENEVFRELRRGQQIDGYIKKIRDDDKIDLCLQRPGYAEIPDFAELIIKQLREHNGFLALTDKSSPEKIYNIFGISKKTYKKALGALYKRKLIEIRPNGIRITDKA